MTPELLPIFVYGTLQRGEERAEMWPRRPVLIEEATIRGQLYDLGSYPALVKGDGDVDGELWHIAKVDFPVTLEVLDQIESFFGIQDTDLYVRRIAPYTTFCGRAGKAYTYFIANQTEITDRQLVGPDSNGRCRWRKLNLST